MGSQSSKANRCDKSRNPPTKMSLMRSKKGSLVSEREPQELELMPPIFMWIITPHLPPLDPLSTPSTPPPLPPFSHPPPQHLPYLLTPPLPPPILLHFFNDPPTPSHCAGRVVESFFSELMLALYLAFLTSMIDHHDLVECRKLFGFGTRRDRATSSSQPP